MNKIKLNITTVLLSFSVFLCSACNHIEKRDNLGSWIGKYEYGWSTPSVVPNGSNLFEVYEISISEENNYYYADISADGWMLKIRAKAKVDGNGEAVELTFLEYTDTSMQPFQKGDTILQLSKSGGDIITKWIAIAPELGSDVGAEGAYFKKIELS